MLQRFSLKVKTMMSFSVVAMVVLIMGLVSTRTLEAVSDDFLHVAKINLPNMTILTKMIQEAQNSHQIILRSMLAESDDEVKGLVVEMEESRKNWSDVTKVYEGVPFVEGESELYDKVQKSWTEYNTLADDFFAKRKSGLEPKQLEELVKQKLAPAHESVEGAVNTLIAFQDKQGVEWSAKAEKQAAMGKSLVFFLVAFGFLCALIIGYLYSTYLAKALTQLGNEISNAGSETLLASKQLSTASQTLSGGSSEAAASLQETVASIEELTSMVKTNAENSKEASALTLRSKVSAEEGENEIRRLIEAMSMAAVQSKKIEEITNVIDDIAFQTNLLALNAAVEAARAGEQGKGFAVVAEAVRNLAHRSASAAKDIAKMISENVENTLAGSEIAKGSAVVLSNIVNDVKKVADLSQEIAAASVEQSSGLEQISKAMNQLDRATQMNAASSEEVAASSEEMSSQAFQLSKLVEKLGHIINGAKQGVETAHAVHMPSDSSATPVMPKLEKLKSTKSNVVKLRPDADKSKGTMIPLTDAEAQSSHKRTIGKVEGF